MAAASRRLPLLDSLRALTTLAILLAHTFGPAGVHANVHLHPYSTRFEFTIAIFLLLSAFLLYRPYARSRLDGRPWPPLKLYAWNRLTRVVPPYWVALTITALWITTAGVGVFTARGIPTYYGFGQIYSHDTVLGGIAIAWFLCILVAFYVVLPVYAGGMRRLGGSERGGRMRAELLGCAALFAFSLAYRALVVALGHRTDPGFNLLLPNYLDWLSAGMALALVSVWYGERWSAADDPGLPRVLRVFQRYPSLGFLIALVAFWAVSTRIGLNGPIPNTGFQYFAEHLLNLVIALGVFVPLAIGDPRVGLTRRALDNRLLLWLSVISYGILLYHLAVIEQLKSWGFDPGAGARSYVLWPIVTLALTLPFAVANHRLIERPLERLSPFRRGRGAAGPPAPDRTPAAAATAE